MALQPRSFFRATGLRRFGALVLGLFACAAGLDAESSDCMACNGQSDKECLQTLTSAMGSVGKSLGAVSDLVSNVRSALSERIDRVSQSVDDVHEELGEVHEGVEEAKREIVATREVIDDIALKQDYSARGIHALCGVVSELLKNAATTPAIANLQNFTLIGARTRGVTPPPLHDAPSRPPLAPPRDPADDLDDGAGAASDLQAAIKNIEALGARAQEATSP